MNEPTQAVGVVVPANIVVKATVTTDVRPPQDVVTVNAENGQESQPVTFTTQLSARLNRAWELARREKQAINGDTSIQERLLRCERQRRGVYDPEKLAEIREAGGSEIYMMLTGIKCAAASAWIQDVLSGAGDDVFDVEAAHEPDLPPEVRAMIVQQVRMEAMNVAFAGSVVTPEAVRDRMEEIRDRVLLEMRNEAEESAERMSNKMRDQLVKGNWTNALREFIDDFVTYPAAILKGPVVKRVPRVTWGTNYKPIVVNDLVQSYYRVSPYDLYPSPASCGPDSGFLIERHRLPGADLFSMIGVPGYDSDAIREVIDRYPHGLCNWLMDDQQRAALEGKSLQFESEDIEVLEYWGPVRGAELKQWGAKGKFDPDRMYDVNAWWVGPYVIKAVVNPHPLGRRPYHTASWEPIPGAFWGGALPEKMRDIAMLCNAAARSLSNNLAIASGPQADVSVDRLPVGENVTEMYPWKVWQSTSDKTGGGQPAVRFFSPDSHAAELMNVYLTFARQADEVTGIPNYVYGSTQVGGAGRTASGLSMLMDNAAKGIKIAVMHIDTVIARGTEMLYLHNMMFDGDVYAKGDFRLIARGATGLIQREAIAARRKEFLAATANPIDMQIMGPEGRAYLLKEVARALQMDTDRLVPNVPKEWSPWTGQGIAGMGAGAGQGIGLQQPTDQPMIGTDGSVMPVGQAGTQTLDAAGNPAGGQQMALPPPR